MKAFTYTYDTTENRTSEQIDPLGASPASTVTSSAYNTVNQLTLTFTFAQRRLRQ